MNVNFVSLTFNPCIIRYYYAFVVYSCLTNSKDDNLTCQEIFLYIQGQPINNEDRKDYGVLVVSTCYIERNTQQSFQSGTDDEEFDTDVGFWIGLSPDGPWESFSSVLPQSIVPKSLNKNPFAFEVSVRNGKKHGVLRALALIANDANIKLEVSVCPVNMLSSPLSNVESGSSTTVIEEVFENQRYQPIAGWGNKSVGFRGNDLGRWSNRDFSYSSKVR